LREFDRNHVNSAKDGRKLVCLIVEILGEAGVITTAAITFGASLMSNYVTGREKNVKDSWTDFSERRITASEPFSAIQRISR
jgi:hypothetical protein